MLQAGFSAPQTGLVGFALAGYLATMISTKNPFPGMNPFLERQWPSVHAKLISFIDDVISRELPPDLVARPEERLSVESLNEASYRPDVSITESWREGVAPSWKPEPSGSIVVAEPELWRRAELYDRWIEIRTPAGRVITVIELLSPSNKGVGFDQYKRKQTDYLSSSTSLVEIDLLRYGHRTVPTSSGAQTWSPGTFYNICCSRAWRPNMLELYRWPLRDRVPAFRVPLRETDRDIVLDLQPLIDRCYEVGRYFLEHHEADSIDPFPADEAAWVNEKLQATGLRAADVNT